MLAAIQKKIKKQGRMNSRKPQKEKNQHESFVEEARQVREVTKAAGLSTKGQDDEVIEEIARNLAEEAEQRIVLGN